MKSSEQFAIEWNLSKRTINDFCNKGKIPGAVTRTTANKIAESLYANDYKKLQKAIAEYMDKSISFYDAGTEGFCHGLVLGLIALMDNQYRIKSNRKKFFNSPLNDKN